MSRFNTLYRGSASDVVDELDDDKITETTVDDLRLALINAMRRIESLELSVWRLNNPNP